MFLSSTKKNKEINIKIFLLFYSNFVCRYEQLFRERMISRVRSIKQIRGGLKN